MPLAATAIDAEDDPFVGAISWSSDLDGELEPDADGNVTLSAGTHAITATATDSTGAEGSATVTIDVARGSHVVTEGQSLRLVAFDEGELIELSTASLAGGNLPATLEVFGMARHPSQPWLYVASMNSCSNYDVSCWGDARIDRFVVDGDELAHDGLMFVYDAEVPAECTTDDWAEPLHDPVGRCALNGMAFSPDGSRLYVDDDDFDWLHVLAVDDEGGLEFVAETAAWTDMHGLTVSADGRYVYNGSNVIDVEADAPANVNEGDARGGNSTMIVEVGDAEVLLSTVRTQGLAAYDPTDPAAPALIDEVIEGGGGFREFVATANGERLVAAASGRVRTVGFDGATFALEDEYLAPDAFTVEYRATGLDRAGDHAVAAWFGFPEDESIGGLDLFTVGEDGTLGFVERVVFEGEGRIVFRVR